MDYIKITIRSYDKSSEKYAKNVEKMYPYAEIKFLKSLLKPKSSILDLGCGSGRDAIHLSKLGYSVTGIDLSKNMIKYAKKLGSKVNFKVMDMKKLNFKDNSFDAVWANASLLHLNKNSISIVLRKIYRMLNKNGLFYLSIKKGKGEGLISDERYGNIKKFWSFYAKNEIEKLLKKNKFSIIRSYIKKPASSYEIHSWIVAFSRK